MTTKPPVTLIEATGTPSNTTFLRGDGTWSTPAGSGDVAGPASSTDNAVARFDLTTGKIIQNSGAIIDDSGNITATNLSGTNTGDQTSVTGNAGTATALQNARTIGGVSFNGTANIVPQTIQIVDAAADTTTFPMLAGSATGSLQPLTDAGLSYNASTNALTAGSFVGPVTGNASTATSLATGRTISITGDLAYTSPSFDGSGNVTASGTFATVNANVGSFTNANITVNAKGLITAASNGSAAGDVVGPASATDNAIARFDLTTGKLIQNSGSTIDDSGNITANSFIGPLTGNSSTATALQTARSIGIAGSTGLTATGVNFDGTAAINPSLTGTLIGANGGTGQSTTAVGDLLQGNTGNTWQKLSAVATGNVLISGGVTTASSWGKVGLTTHVSGTLPVANGGTGATTFTANGILLGNGTSAVTQDALLAWDSTNKRILNSKAVTGVEVLEQLGGTGTQTLNAVSSIAFNTGVAVNSGGEARIGGIAESATGGVRQTGLIFYTDDQATGGIAERARISATGTVRFNNLAGTGTRLVQASSTGTLSASANPLPVASGGTGIASLTAGYIPYGDGTNPFASNAAFLYDTASGSMSVGGSFVSGVSGTSRLQLTNTGSNQLQIGRFSNDAGGSAIVGFKSRGTTQGSNTIVQSGDTLLAILGLAANGTSYDSACDMMFVVDGTPGASGDMPGRIDFRTTPDGSNVIAQRMRIGNDGYVTVNNTGGTPGAAQAGVRISPSPVTGASISSGGAVTTAQTHWQFANGNGVIGSISTNGSATAYNIASDYRLKTDFIPLSGALDKVMKLPVYQFRFKTDAEDYFTEGFKAHELQEISPRAVTGEKDAVDENNEPVYQQVDQSKLVPLLVAAVQELQKEIEKLKNMLNGI